LADQIVEMSCGHALLGGPDRRVDYRFLTNSKLQAPQCVNPTRKRGDARPIVVDSSLARASG
jgi:hypothetical protein